MKTRGQKRFVFNRSNIDQKYGVREELEPGFLLNAEGYAWSPNVMVQDGSDDDDDGFTEAQEGSYTGLLR